MDHLIWTMYQNQEFLANPIQAKRVYPLAQKNTLHLGHNQILQNPSSSKLAHKNAPPDDQSPGQWIHWP